MVYIRIVGRCPAMPKVAVGTRISPRPPHRSRRALLTHRAPPSGRTSCDERSKCRSSSDAQPSFGSTRHFGSVSEPRPPNGCSPWVRPFPPRLPPRVASPCSVASQVSGRRRRARLLLRWPPSAAQTGRAVFPHPAFMNGLLRPEAKGSVRPARPA